MEAMEAEEGPFLANDAKVSSLREYVWYSCYSVVCLSFVSTS